MSRGAQGKQMKISVIIATYRRPQYLEKCLRSLLAQTRLPDEVIIGIKTYDEVTESFLQRFSRMHDFPFRMRIVQVSSHPVFVAENKGLEVATGDIVSFVDDDAEPYPDWLERIEAHFQDQLVGGVGGPDIPTSDRQPTPRRMREGDDIGKINWWGRMTETHDKTPSRQHRVDLLKGCNMSLRRDLLQRIGNLIGHYRWEDDLCLDIADRGFHIVFAPDVRVLHHRAASEATSSLREKENIYASNHNCTYIYLKHFSGARKLGHLLYSFWWGDIDIVGLGFWLRELLRRKDIRFVPVLGYAYQGKVAGVISYLSEQISGRWISHKDSRQDFAAR